jgi:cation:H+ antiporter
VVASFFCVRRQLKSGGKQRMSVMTLVLFAIGLGLLVLGAEWLVRGAARLAATAGMSSLVIGLTVVSFGTSAPELAVSTQSAFSGQADIALGNVIGSNIFNVLLILGISAVITPLVVQRQLVRLDVPVMIGISFLVLLLGLDGRLGRIDGLLLVTGLLIYIGFQIWQGRKATAAEAAPSSAGADDTPEPIQTPRQLIWDVLLVGAGLGLLVIGSRWMVDGAVEIARYFGLSELVIGLTIVAIGTSLPEVAASIIAALRGERDIAVGNVVGSNIFNILGILGITSALAPEGVGVAASALAIDIPIMIAVAVACLPIFFTGWTIARWEGWLLLGYYAAYMTYVLLAATQHNALPIVATTLGLIALPATALILLFLSGRAFVGQRQTPA